MENELIVCIIIFALLLLMDMFFYGFGEAVRNLNRKELDERVVENEDKRYVLLSQIADEPSEYINTLQVFATGSLILSGALYYDMLIKLGGRLRLLLLLVPVYILLSFGVLMPKKVAARYPEKFALTCTFDFFVKACDRTGFSYREMHHAYSRFGGSGNRK